jgi:hypothetical protein
MRVDREIRGHGACPGSRAPPVAGRVLQGAQLDLLHRVVDLPVAEPVEIQHPPHPKRGGTFEQRLSAPYVHWS